VLAACTEFFPSKTPRTSLDRLIKKIDGEVLLTDVKIDGEVLLTDVKIDGEVLLTDVVLIKTFFC